MKPIVTKVLPQGCCGGVLQAISIAKRARQRDPQKPITILGNLVHNSYVKQALAHYDLQTIEDPGKTRLELLDQIDKGIVIFTAHGVSPQVYQKAKEKGLEIVDATCPFVRQTQKIVQDHLDQGDAIFYIGKKGHPEAESVYSSDPNVYLIEKKEDIPASLSQPIFVTNQTTMSILEIQPLFTAIQEIYPNAKIQNEICNATRVRQQAILDLKGSDVDALVVVGDPTSNNTQKLATIAKDSGIPFVCSVADAQELPLDRLQKCHHIAITSGASTPTYLTDQIMERIQDPEQKLQAIDLDQILDQ